MLTREQISNATIIKQSGSLKIIETGFNFYVIKGNEVISKHRLCVTARLKLAKLEGKK